MKNILHLCYTNSDPWVLPIWTAFNEAEKRKKITKSRKFSTGSGGIYISTKLNCLKIIYGRINKNTEEVIKIVMEAKDKNPKYCFDGVSNKTIFSLLLDIETYFRQAFSIIEFIEEFTGKLFSYINDRGKGDAVKFLSDIGYKNLDWYNRIEKNRHSLTHATALWVDVIIAEPYDLLIETKHSKTLQSRDDYLTLSELRNIDLEFRNLLKNIQEKLISYFKNL